MSQDECSTEARRYTQGKTNKEGTTRSGATAPTERDKAPARQQSTTHRGSKTKSPFCVVLKIFHLNTWILHKTCLKHSNFLNRKILCTWNIMATTMGQGTEETQRVETRFKIQQFQHFGWYVHRQRHSEPRARRRCPLAFGNRPYQNSSGSMSTSDKGARDG